MSYRLASERIEITLEDGPTVEVETIGSLAVFRSAMGLASASLNDPEDLPALQRLCELFMGEAQPTWSLLDHRGPIPATVTGMLRLPVGISLPFFVEWIQTFIPKTSAVDEIVPPGPVRDELNRALKRKRNA